MVQLTERPRPTVEAPPVPDQPSPRRRFDVLIYLGLLVVGLLLRLHDLGSRAYHHDESLHAVYSWYLYVGRGYVHDPLMHGPFQFHVSALMFFLFGDSNVTGRLAAVLFGTGIIALPYFLRAELGRWGAIATSVLFTISPAFLYFSRFTREDIFLAFFTLGMVVGLFGWIRTRNPRYLYFASLSLICAFADKEATYIHGFVFVTFFAFLAATAPLHRFWRPAWETISDIRPRLWLECTAIFLVIYVLLFTTFLTNLGDPWNCLRGRPCNPGGLWSGSVGALSYWLDQHGVQRGGQPFYYYAILLPLYELVPLIFGTAAVFSRWFRGSLFGWFCLYWFLGSFVIYSWAGEKMPWLVPHLALPLVLLAGRRLGDWFESLDWRGLMERRSLVAMGLGLLVVSSLVATVAVGAFQALSPIEGQTFALERLSLGLVTVAAVGGLVYLAIRKRTRVVRALTAVAMVVLGAWYIHTSWMVTYAHGDIPVEMLVYVQSSPDIPWVSREIERIGFQTGQRQDLRILMDGGYSEVVGGQNVVHESVSWPFEWYLRDYKNRRYYSKTIPQDVNLRDYPVVLVMAPNLDPVRDQLGDYVGQKYRLNWWYPEDYKNWQSQPGSVWTSLSDPATRARLLKYLVYREPLNPLGSREFYFFVRKDVPTLGPAPGAVQASPAAPAAQAAASGPVEAVAEPVGEGAALLGVGKAGEPLLGDPKGVAVDGQGRVYVAEGKGNRITVLNADGTMAARWGRPGSGDGEFAEPWGIAVAPSGEVFVADTWNHRIQKFSADGRFLGSWGGLLDARRDPRAAGGQFWGPRDIAIGPDGLLYVSDTGNKRIQVFDANGTFIRMFGTEGSDPGQFNEPVGLAFDGDTLLVVDAWNGRIQRLDATGAPLGAIPVAGWESKSIQNKPFIAIDAAGRIYVTAPERGEVMLVGTDGQARSVRRPNDSQGRLGTPTGVEIGPGGELYVGESSGGTLTRQADPSGR